MRNIFKTFLFILLISENLFAIRTSNQPDPFKELLDMAEKLTISKITRDKADLEIDEENDKFEKFCHFSAKLPEETISGIYQYVRAKNNIEYIMNALVMISKRLETTKQDVIITADSKDFTFEFVKPK